MYFVVLSIGVVLLRVLSPWYDKAKVTWTGQLPLGSRKDTLWGSINLEASYVILHLGFRFSDISNSSRIAVLHCPFECISGLYPVEVGLSQPLLPPTHRNLAMGPNRVALYRSTSTPSIYFTALTPCRKTDPPCSANSFVAQAVFASSR